MIALFAMFPLPLFKTFHSDSRTEFPKDNSDETLELLCFMTLPAVSTRNVLSALNSSKWFGQEDYIYYIYIYDIL